jgi:predicted nucleic acid-binding protein
MPDGEKKKLNIYLDNCCYNRPYDDQTQLRIELETKAKLFIQNLIVKDKVDLTVSSASILENKKNPFSERRLSIRDFFRFAKYIATSSSESLNEAKNFKSAGLKTYDAVHLAFAVQSDCDYFVTTDDRLLRFYDDRIRIINPQEFINVWEAYGNDE